MQRIVTLFLILTLIVLQTAAAQSNTVSFKDSEFNSKDWEMVVITTGSGGPPPNVAQQLIGGNPGAFRTIEITAQGGSKLAPSNVATFHRKAGAVFDPANQAIQSIDYSEDVKMIKGTPNGGGMYIGPALQQADAAGKMHYYVVPNTFSMSPANWTTRKFAGLTAADFVELTDRVTKNALDMSQHPNFQKGAKPIQFGFWRGVQDTSSGGGCGSYGGGDGTTMSEGIDNWTLTLTAGQSLGASCVIDPRNSFLPLHLPVFHTLFPDRNPDHKVTVVVLNEGAPAANAAVSIQSEKKVFGGGGSSGADTASGKTDARGAVAFALNPAPPQAFDRTDLTASGTVGGNKFTCTGSVTTGIGGLSEMLKNATDTALTAAVALANEHRDELGAPVEFFPGDIRDVPLSDRGRLLLYKALNRYDPIIRKGLAGQPVKLSARQRKELESLLAEFEKETSWHVQNAVGLLRTSLKTGKLSISELRRQTGANQAGEPRLREPRRGSSERARIERDYGNLPLTFEANLGQFAEPVRYLARGAGYRLYLTPVEAVLVDDTVPKWAAGKAAEIRIELAGASRVPRIEPEQQLATHSNYLLGADPRRWKTGVPHYSQVRYAGVYPGVDVLFQGSGRNLQFDFTLEPGARSENIRLAFWGAEKMAIDGSGNIVLDHISGQLKVARPLVYQVIDGVRRTVESRYVMRGRYEAGFEIARYDASHPLVIDPVISYATYLGGERDESAAGIAIDGDGNAYIAGVTSSRTFPTASPFQGAYAESGPFGTDAFVAKLNATGTALLYSTYIGGSGLDGAVGIAVDAQGVAYVTGSTTSPDFPLSQPIQNKLKGGGFLGGDGFVLKLDPSGSSLVYSTYIGGSDLDNPKAIAVDPQGNAYITGTTASADFPVKNAYQPGLRGGTLPFNSDAFVVKINPSGTDFVYSTYLGGRDNDFGYGIATDKDGNAYVVGSTHSTDFPVVTPFQNSQKGAGDAFVAKLNPSGSALVYSTYLGGESSDAALAIAVDDSGAAYLTGITGSSDFPLKNPIQPKFGAANNLGGDAFLAKLAPNGQSLVYSTYIGGTATETGAAIAVGKDGSAYVAGQTDSADFPTLGDPFQPASTGGADGFLVKVNPAGSAFSYASFLGGSGADAASAVAVDKDGNAYVAGSTSSIDFPVTQGAFQTANRGQTDVFVAKIVDGVPTPRIAVVSNASLKPGGAPEAAMSAIGSGLGSSNRTVTVKDSQGVERGASVSLTSDKRINFVVPKETAPGLAMVSVLNGSQLVAAGNMLADSVAPALYSADGSGAGVAQATQTRTAADGTVAESPIYRCAGSACTASPVDVGDPNFQVALNLTASGVRGRSSLDNVRVVVDGLNVAVTAAGPSPDTPGVDVVTAGPLPKDLAGRGVVQLTVIADGRVSNPVSVLFGKAASGSGAAIDAPSALDFGAVTVGQARDLKLTIRNVGGAVLNVASLSVGNAGFSVVSPAGAFTVAAGAQADITIRFSPRAAGSATDTLAIASNDAARPRVAVSLSGSGAGASGGNAVISVTPDKLDFGTIMSTATKDLTISISGATGTSPLVVQSFDLSGSRFSLVNTPALPATLTFAPATLTIRYTPTGAATDTGTLLINSNASNQPVYRVTFTGTAVLAGSVELKVDDGTFEGSAGFKDGASLAHYLNRLTPPAYPATLTAIRLYFNDRQGQADPNTVINLLSASNPSGGSAIEGLRFNGSSAVVNDSGRWLEFAVKQPITINTGDFVVGFSMSNPPGVYPLAADTSSVSQGRSYTSPDGTKFTVLPASNIAIRAVVTVGR